MEAWANMGDPGRGVHGPFGAQWSESDLRLLIEKISAGETQGSLCRELGISRPRVGQLCQRARQTQTTRAPPQLDPLLTLLCARTRNHLIAEGLDRDDLVLFALRGGCLSRVPGIGSASLQEIRRIFGT